MISTLLMLAPVLLAAPEVAPQTVHLGPPTMFTGRRRGYAATEWEVLDKAVAEGQPVPVQCKEMVPSMFSGRPIRKDCDIEIVPPHIETTAPAIFSGRSPKRGEVIVGARALQYYPAATVGKTATQAQEVFQQQTQASEAQASGQVYMPAPAVPKQPRRRAPSIFSGRRARPAQ